ncbi:MAG: hypothetical protein CMM99_02880 [Rickettsiales bacterium]|nr:hypothetical protein [Rickettsiales bacterium]
MEILKEFIIFLKNRNKLFLLPLLSVIIILGGLLVIVEGTVVAPFIYTLF